MLNHRRPAVPEVVPIPTLLSTSNRLSSALSDLKRQKVESDALVEKSGQERSALDSQEAELKAEIGRVSSKYEWFLDFRSWIEDVAAFLEEKFPRLEKIEADNVSVQRERLSMLNLRRYKDDSDDVALFTGVAAPTKPPAASSSSSTGQGKNGSQQDMDIDQDEVDEMGRSRSEMDLEPRSYSRKIRREERQKRLLLSSRQQEGASDSSSPEGNGDGDLSDSELLTSDSQDLQAAGESLEAATKQLFADVAASEYIEPTVGIEPRFVEWRRQYREDFNDAFGGLAMVGVWEFWARCELATWNPFCVKELGQSPNSLEHFKWHRALTHFQHERAASLELSSGGAEQVDPGDDVVAGMATTVVIPRLRKLVAEGFDTYSSKANSTALGLVEEISYCVEPTSPRFEVGGGGGGVLFHFEGSPRLTWIIDSARRSPSFWPSSVASSLRSSEPRAWSCLLRVRLQLPELPWTPRPSQLGIVSLCACFDCCRTGCAGGDTQRTSVFLSPEQGQGRVWHGRRALRGSSWRRSCFH